MKNTHKEGYAMIASLTGVAVMTGASTMLLGMTAHNAHREQRGAEQRHAKIMSEAGVRKAYARLRYNPAFASNALKESSLNGGRLKASLLNKSAGIGVGNAILRSSSFYNGIEATSAIAVSFPGLYSDTDDLNNEPAVEDFTLALFESVIFCGKAANMTGNSSIDLNGGIAQINGTLRMVGSSAFNNSGLVRSCSGISLSGNVMVDADVVAPEIDIPNESSVSGEISQEAVPEQFIEIDLQPFYGYAKIRNVEDDYSRSQKAVITDSYISADELKKGTFTLNAQQVLRPAGGVVWIEGEVKLNGGSVVEGCVIATGDIKVCGSMTHINPNGLPSFMSQSGDVELNSGCVAYGLLYSHAGDIRIGGSATVEGGAFICPRGSFTHNGSGRVVCSGSYPLGPNGEDITLPNLMDTVETEEGELPVPAYMGWIE